MRNIVACMAALVVLLPVAAFSAQSGALDSSGGYGRHVLEKVVPLWRPAGDAGPVTVTVRIGSGGEVLYCGPRTSSGNQAVDMAACTAVAQAGTFTPPPGGMPVEVHLSLPGVSAPAPIAENDQHEYTQPGDPAPAALSVNYADVVMDRIRPYVKVPEGFRGEAVVVVHLKVDEQGRVVSEEIVEASGNSPTVNETVLKAIAQAGTMPPPPQPSQKLVLTFTVRGL